MQFSRFVFIIALVFVGIGSMFIGYYSKSFELGAGTLFISASIVVSLAGISSLLEDLL